jgi:Tol biopolymer transport system component
VTARLLVWTLAALAASIGLASSAGASVPGAEGRIAFTSSRDGNADLYSVWADGSVVRRLTWTPASEQSPAWSPDMYATKLAYESDASGRFRIHMMDWDGDNQTRVSPEGSDLDDDVHPTWSPEATRIAFASTRGGGWHIWTMNADGTNLRRLTEGLAVEPAWSPMGAWIAYAWNDSIWLVNSDGTNPRRLTVPTGRSVAAPAWSPDGSEIVLSRFGENGLPGELFVASVFSPGQERQLTSGGFGNARPSWSPDGTEIVFQRLTPTSGGWQLMAIRPDGSGEREVQPTGGGDLTPAWGSSLHLPPGIEPVPPTIQFYSPLEGDLFWQGQDARAFYVCSSPTAIVVSCVGDAASGSPLDTATAGLRTFTVTGVDNEGRTTTATVSYQVVDVIRPQLELRTPRDGAEYGVGEAVTVDYSCTDPGGGVEFCDGTLPSGAPLPTDVVGTYTFFVYAVDTAHHVTEVAVTYRVVDRTPPSIVITAPAENGTYTLGESVSASFVCDDNTGVAYCEGSTTVATDVVGTHTFTVAAADWYGNNAAVSKVYSVVYPFSGFFAPLASAARFSAGETIPVKFGLGGNHGLDVLLPGSPAWRHVPCGSPARDGGTFAATGRLSYNAANDRYLYRVETKATWAGGCLEFVLTLKDGTSHPVVIAFDSRSPS